MAEQNERPEQSVMGMVAPPRESDKLFRSGEGWQMNACLNYGSGSWLYSNGYLTAAQSLVAQVIETCREQDRLIYPIVYLYRHHCELTLKGITFLASQLLEKRLEKSQKDALDSHELLPL